MQQFARLLPYLWQYRWKLYASMGFALVVAALWAATLSLTYLVVTVLLKDQSLQQFVDLEVQNCEVEIDKREHELDELERQLEALAFAATQESKPTPSDKEILRRQERATRKLSAERQKLVACRWIQRHVMPWIPTDQFHTYAWILGILVIGTMLKGTAVFIQEVLVGSVVELTVMALRKDCFRHALDLDYQSLMRHGKPELMSRFTNDISVAADGLNLIGGRIVREPLKAIACIVVALLVNWQLTMMSMVFVPVMFVIFNRYGKLLKRASHQMMERMSRIYKSLEETFDSLKVVFAFNGERRHRQRFHRENKDYYHQAMKVVQIDSLTSPTTELLLTLAVCVSLLPGAYLVLRHEDTIWGIKLASAPMSIEDLSWLYALLAGTLDPVRKLSSIYSKIKRSAAATERIFQVLDWQPALKQLEQPQHLPRHSQSISLKKVSFRYDSDGIDRPNALTDVTLKIAAGEVVVVVGENGSGKSTLVNLLPRFYDPNSGSVLIDGVDIRNVRLRDLRSQIGVVTQETLLFDDSIYENIRYGNPDATHAEVLAAAEKSHIPQFLDQLPEGFATRVGPRGNRLSGGQRQRVALARALLIDPSILILDEATSAVDAQSESLIHQCLGDFVKGRTVFLITHSVTPEILQFATRIVILEQGQLLAAGAHEEVLQSCPAYQRLFRAQTSAQGSDSQIEFHADSSTATDTNSDPKTAVELPLVLKFPPANQAASSEAHRKAN